MNHTYTLSDLHLGHDNICNFRPQFSSPEEHDELILENYRSTVNKNDTVIFGGDVAFTKEKLQIISELKGNKILIAGNHDLERGITMRDLVGAYDHVYSLWTRRGCWLSHAPIHPDELRGRFNVHGHVHYNTLPDPRYYNISMENIDYKPKKFLDIVAELKERNEVIL